MKRLLRLLAFRSRAPRGPCLSPSPSPRCPPCAPCLKPPPGDARFCAFTAPTCPEPIRGNPRLRAETCPSGPTGLEKPNRNNGQCNTHPKPPKSLHRVAVCCSVLHRVSPKNFSHLRCNTSQTYFWCRPRALTRRSTPLRPNIRIAKKGPVGKA